MLDSFFYDTSLSDGPVWRGNSPVSDDSSVFCPVLLAHLWPISPGQLIVIVRECANLPPMGLDGTTNARVVVTARLQMGGGKVEVSWAGSWR